jgi:hypothetical protein
MYTQNKQVKEGKLLRCMMLGKHHVMISTIQPAPSKICLMTSSSSAPSYSKIKDQSRSRARIFCPVPFRVGTFIYIHAEYFDENFLANPVSSYSLLGTPHHEPQPGETALSTLHHTCDTVQPPLHHFNTLRSSSSYAGSTCVIC